MGPVVSGVMYVHGAGASGRAARGRPSGACASSPFRALLRLSPPAAVPPRRSARLAPDLAHGQQHHQRGQRGADRQLGERDIGGLEQQEEGGQREAEQGQQKGLAHRVAHQDGGGPGDGHQDQADEQRQVVSHRTSLPQARSGRARC
ncbi:hypothetical protein HOK021_28790 [Streptomyces hygroscopicus]|nr:hypothetical protein HOK021_28790 [Streptomyces hygroscopicus]